MSNDRDGGHMSRSPQQAPALEYRGSSFQRPQEPATTPAERDADQAHTQQATAEGFVDKAAQLAKVPAHDWPVAKADLTRRIDDFVAALATPQADRSAAGDAAREKTAASITKARALIERATPPRAVPAVPGELELAPRVADKSAAPEDVIAWMERLPLNDREVVWDRYKHVSGGKHASSPDHFAIDLANFIAAHRDRQPPLSAALRRLAKMSPKQVMIERARQQAEAAAADTDDDAAGSGTDIDEQGPSPTTGAAGDGTAVDDQDGGAYAGLSGTFEARAGVDLGAEAIPGTFESNESKLLHVLSFGSPFTMPRKYADPLYGPVFKKLREREVIRGMVGGDRDPVSREIANVLGDLANDPAYYVAFAVGAVKGTGRAIYDTVKGFQDSADLIADIGASLMTFQYADLMRRATAAIDDLRKAAPQLMGAFLARWTDEDSTKRGAFQGEVVAYILTQLAILIAGSVAGSELAIGGEFAAIIRALGWLDNPIEGFLLLEGRLSATTVQALRAGAGAGRKARTISVLGEAIPGMTQEMVREFERFEQGAGAAGGARRELATADDLAHQAEVGGSTKAAQAARAIDEIGAMQVGFVRRGSAPGIERDTLTITHSDGARLPALLHAVSPQIEIKPYPKGLLVRHGADAEWWIEFHDDATRLGAGRAPAVGASEGGIGLPEPNVATVEVWAFQGQRKRPDWTPAQLADYENVKKQQPMLWAGHVGISMDGGKTIYGLTPDSPLGMRAPEVVDRLKRHEAFPGKVGDDTEIFNDAQEAVDRNGWDTHITKTVMILDRPERSDVLARVRAMAGMDPGGHGLGYSFPLEEAHGGEWFAPSRGFDADQVRNCATFPEKVGVPIPERSGNMKRYMPELEKWAGADAPFDARAKETKP